jgi:hypothetical protein
MSAGAGHVARSSWIAVTSGFALIDHKNGETVIKLERDADGWLWASFFGDNRPRFPTYALHTKSLKDAKPVAVEMFCGWLDHVRACATEAQ